MLKKIYNELVLIRKELQAIRGSKEFNITIENKGIAKAVARGVEEAIDSSIRDTGAKVL